MFSYPHVIAVFLKHNLSLLIARSPNQINGNIYEPDYDAHYFVCYANIAIMLPERHKVTWNHYILKQ